MPENKESRVPSGKTVRIGPGRGAAAQNYREREIMEKYALMAAAFGALAITAASGLLIIPALRGFTSARPSRRSAPPGTRAKTARLPWAV
ncbi:MAG: hypothetical protein ACLRZH_10115 [Ruthenibacterium lactatiformans]